MALIRRDAAMAHVSSMSAAHRANKAWEEKAGGTAGISGGGEGAHASPPRMAYLRCSAVNAPAAWRKSEEMMAGRRLSIWRNDKA